MRILISAVGDTDPIRNFHDGALVHIARKYRPDKIIIIFCILFSTNYSLPLF